MCLNRVNPEQEAQKEYGPADNYGVLRGDGPGDNNIEVEQFYKLETPNRFRVLEVNDPDPNKAQENDNCCPIPNSQPAVLSAGLSLQKENIVMTRDYDPCPVSIVRSGGLFSPAAC